MKTNGKNNSHPRAKKILLVDDDRSILEVITIILQDEGYDVKSLSNAEHIREKVEDIMPDLILLDYWLPGYDTGEIVRSLKTKSKIRNIPIFMVSAHHISEKDILDIGADGFLGKPFDMYELLRKIHSFMV